MAPTKKVMKQIAGSQPQTDSGDKEIARLLEKDEKHQHSEQAA
jgi:hypothetical protein